MHSGDRRLFDAEDREREVTSPLQDALQVPVFHSIQDFSLELFTNDRLLLLIKYYKYMVIWYTQIQCKHIHTFHQSGAD